MQLKFSVWLVSYMSDADLKKAVKVIEDGLIDPTHATQGYTAFEATSYCLYDTTTLGTPKSPVFDSLKDMAAWIKQDNDGRTLNHILANLVSLLQ